MADFALRSQSARFWKVGGLLAGALLLVVGWFLLISPLRSDTAAVNAQVSTERAGNAALQARIDTLRSQSARLPHYRAQLAAAQQALPTSAAIPAFLRSLQTLGATTHTSVTNVTAGTPTAIVPAAAAAPTSTPTDAASSTSTPVVVTPAPSAYSVTIGLQVSGSPGELQAFLGRLQADQPRAVLISQLTEGSSSSTGGSSGGTALQLTMQAFVAAPAAAASSVPTGATPMGTSTTTQP